MSPTAITTSKTDTLIRTLASMIFSSSREPS